LNLENAKQFFKGPVSPKEAVAWQAIWRGQVSKNAPRGSWRRICGVDVAYDPSRNLAFAAAVVVSFPELAVLEKATAVTSVQFPYIPGLLGFREAPVVLLALEKLAAPPDLLMVDGHGVAHPRRCGIATMMGLALRMPVIGCAKSRLVGEYREPGPRVGAWSPLRDGRETLGAVVRTREGARPVFVSVGHAVSLPFAIRKVLACGTGFRLPLPTHLADREAGKAKRDTDEHG
jgi:deoxyribonuclease V